MKGTRNGFRGCNTVNKVNPNYLEGKPKEFTFH